MASATKKKWDQFSWLYKWNTYGAERRWATWKRDFFSRMGDGKILFLAVGVGSEIRHFPVGRDIVGIDISTEMLKRAAEAASKYRGKLELREMDARQLLFDDDYFDQIFTSCTFCSVPEPIAGLKELKRVLKPGGELRMFEHTISDHFPFRQMLTIMNPIAEKIGPSLNRNTVLNVTLAGFVIKQIFNIYLDVVKTIHAVKPKA
ncbi:MAG: class I SAM-dependent methyltransferase [Desulfobacterales bacterium]